MKASIVAAALVGSAAAGHQAHAGFHFRRGGYADSEVCTVYTTVYVTALPSMAANSTIYATPSPVPVNSTSSAASCTEEYSTLYTPPAYTPSPPPPAPTSEVYVPPPPPPSSSSVKEVSTPAHTPPAYTPPAYTPPAYTPPAYTPPAYTPPAYTPPAYTPPAHSAAPPKPKPSKPAGGSGEYGHRITPNGNKWAITYTPYAPNGDCKTAGDVYSDIEKIASLGYTSIRSYSTDCGVFENVVPACSKHGLKIIYGIFLDAGKGPFSSGAEEQLNDIIAHAPKDSIAMMIVGNESIFGHGIQVGDLAAYIKHVREKLAGAGFPNDIPITTAEPVGTWEQYGAQLCDVIDVMAAQVHPFFDGGITAGEAGDFAVKQLAQAAKVCPKAAAAGTYISEIGWPSAGDTNGAAVPGYSQQKEAINSIIEAVGEKACIFSFQNDSWKEPGALNVEQYFGCADILP